MKVWIWLLLSLLAGSISWLYMSRVLDPWDAYIGAQHDGIKNQMWDLYPRWVGARELLLHGRNPYGPEVSQEIQVAYYGHGITQDYAPGHKIVDEWRFAYPVYVVFLMAPLLHVDFAEVQRWAPSVLGLFAAICVPLSLSHLRWRLPWQNVVSITLFVVGSPQIVQGMRNQQLSLVVGFLLISGAWCVSKNHLASAGALLAWSTIKPQMVLLPLCFFLVWTLGDWARRWRLLAGFLAMLTCLIGAGELLLPGWIGYFLAGAAAYTKYFPATSLLRVALGDTLGAAMGGILALALLAFAWRNRNAAAHSRQFTSMFAAFLMGAILAFPLFTPFNQVMLILPTMLLLHDWTTLPKFSRRIFIVSVSWSWIISSGLLLFPPRLNSPSQLPLLPSFLVLFFPLFLPLLLMTRYNRAADPQGVATDLPRS